MINAFQKGHAISLALCEPLKFITADETLAQYSELVEVI